MISLLNITFADCYVRGTREKLIANNLSKFCTVDFDNDTETHKIEYRTVLFDIECRIWFSLDIL